MKQSLPTREFEILVYGATGFTGRQAAQYLSKRLPNHVPWAIAGRNLQRLQRVVETLVTANPPIVLVADALDEKAIDTMCSRTRIVASTAGPFARYGRILVEKCVLNRCHYLDITGETAFVADIIDAFHDTARAQGTQLIPCCGFDSAPSDLGVWLAIQAMRTQKEHAADIVGAFRLRGGLNGGTVASGLSMAEDGVQSRMDDPFLLTPRSHHRSKNRKVHTDVQWPRYHKGYKTWLAPFIMAPINTRVVRRSDALWTENGLGYGKEFTYQEYLECRGALSYLKALSIALGLKTVNQLFRWSWGRRLIRKFSPKPGEGPSIESMDSGYFQAQFIAKTESNRYVRVTMFSKGDPGNRVTIKIMCEAAMALALDDRKSGEKIAGVLTPSTALGGTLVKRLEEIGFVFTVEWLDDA